MLTARDARRLALRAQLLRGRGAGHKAPSLVQMTSLLVGVQYDPMPLIMPNHYMVYWNRITGTGTPFTPNDLDRALYREHTLMEHFGLRRVTSIISAEEFPTYRAAAQLPLGQGWAERARNRVDTAEAQRLLRRIREDGPVKKSDLATDEERRFLYALFWFVPEVVVAKRLPGVFREPELAWGPDAMPHVDFDTQPDMDGAVTELVVKTVAASGACAARHVAFWIGCRVRDVRPYIAQLVDEGLLTSVRVEGRRQELYVRPADLDWAESEESATPHPPPGQVYLLTPLDNLIRDKKWLERVFHYTFRTEYFQVKGMRWHTSVLLGDEIVGFVDPKADRPHREFIIKEVALCRPLDDPGVLAVVTRLQGLAAAHGCTVLRFVDPPGQWATAIEEMGGKKDGEEVTLPVECSQSYEPDGGT